MLLGIVYVVHVLFTDSRVGKASCLCNANSVLDNFGTLKKQLLNLTITVCIASLDYTY